MTLEAATENQATLKAIDEALGRMKSPARITIWLECPYVYGALLQKWPEKWETAGWITAKGTPVKDAKLWASVLGKIRLHEVSLKLNQQHEYRSWMKRELEKETSCTGATEGSKHVG